MNTDPSTLRTTYIALQNLKTNAIYQLLNKIGLFRRRIAKRKESVQLNKMKTFSTGQPIAIIGGVVITHANLVTLEFS